MKSNESSDSAGADGANLPELPMSKIKHVEELNVESDNHYFLHHMDEYINGNEVVRPIPYDVVEYYYNRPFSCDRKELTEVVKKLNRLYKKVNDNYAYFCYEFQRQDDIEYYYDDSFKQHIFQGISQIYCYFRVEQLSAVKKLVLDDSVLMTKSMFEPGSGFNCLIKDCFISFLDPISIINLKYVNKHMNKMISCFVSAMKQYSTEGVTKIIPYSSNDIDFLLEIKDQLDIDIDIDLYSNILLGGKSYYNDKDLLLDFKEKINIEFSGDVSSNNEPYYEE